MWEKDELKIKPNPDVIEQYDRKKLTKKLADVFDDVSEMKK